MNVAGVRKSTIVAVDNQWTKVCGSGALATSFSVVCADPGRDIQGLQYFAGAAPPPDAVVGQDPILIGQKDPVTGVVTPVVIGYRPVAIPVIRSGCAPQPNSNVVPAYCAGFLRINPNAGSIDSSVRVVITTE